MHELTGPDGFAELQAASAATFGRAGLDVDLGGEVPPDALAAAIADGFTLAIVLPGAGWQLEHREALASAFATGEGWDEPYLAVDGLVPEGRPEGPYVLAIQADPRRDDDLRGLTAPAIRKALGGDACLTVEEYLVVQRTMAERSGDHAFDDYSGDPSGWMWLAGSGDGARTAMGYWNGAKGRVEVTACKTGSKNPRKGARRARIIPLDPA